MTERARPSFRRMPGRARRYLDLSTGKEISRRQYIKKTENIKSLEEKAKRYKEKRQEIGEPQPMKRYNAVVREYKASHPGARVRGAEGKEFQKLYAELKKPRHGWKQRQKHIEVLHRIGIINSKQREAYQRDLEMEKKWH